MTRPRGSKPTVNGGRDLWRIRVPNLQIGGRRFDPTPGHHKRSMGNQSSPRTVAVASYSPVVPPSVGLTGAPPGHVWPPPLTVMSLAPPGDVVLPRAGTTGRGAAGPAPPP